MAADETQGRQQRTAADEKQGRQPRTVADETQKRAGRMTADETQRGRDEIASYEKGDAEVGVDGADGAIIVNERIMKIK